MTATETRTLTNKIADMLRGATLTPEEGKLIVAMAKSRTRDERPDAYLLAIAKELMPDAAYIEWARAHLAKLG